MAGKIRTAIADRWHVVQHVYWRPLVAVVVAAYAVISLDSTLSGEFASAGVQKAIRLGNFIPHLSAWIWVTIGLGLLLLLGIEGAVREFRREDQRHTDALAKSLAEQQDIHEKDLAAALDAQRQDYEKKLAEAARPQPQPQPLVPRYEQREPYRQPDEYSSLIEYRVGIQNPPGNPLVTGVRLEWTAISPEPPMEVKLPPIEPPQPVPRLAGGDPGIGIPLPPGRENFWVIATATVVGSDGAFRVGVFSKDSMGGHFRGLLWLFRPGRPWHLSYRIVADNLPPAEFGVVMTAVDGKIRCDLEPSVPA